MLSRFKPYRISRELLEMGVLCRDFMWFPLPGQQLSLFSLKAAALFEAWVSGILEKQLQNQKEKKATVF